MKLSAPTQAVFLIAVILGLLGILGHYGIIAAATGYSFVLVMIAFILLALGCLLKGL